MQRTGTLLATVAHLALLGSIGIPILTTIVVLTATGIATLVVLVGFLLLALAMLGLLAVAWFERERVAGLYGAPVPPAVFRGSPRTDWLRIPHRLLRIITDGQHWRAILSFFLASIFGAVTLPLLGLVGLGLPLALAGLGAAETVVVPLTSIPVPVEWAPLLGILALAGGVAGTIGLAIAHRSLTLGLLVPDDRERLEQAARDERDRRHGAVRAADLDRTRIERDLHDGVQPRLVSIAMQLGMARDRIEADPAGAKALIEEAHASSKSAVTELRQLARGIHASVLDDRGLDAALSALAGRSHIPVHLDVRLDTRCDRNAEAAVYFAIAETLTNAAKHSRASECRVIVRQREGGTLWARVEDDGVGGAQVIPGGGLDGISNRILAAGGTVRLDSPQGGPTSLEVSVPCAS